MAIAFLGGASLLRTFLLKGLKCLALSLVPNRPQVSVGCYEHTDQVFSRALFTVSPCKFYSAMRCWDPREQNLADKWTSTETETNLTSGICKWNLLTWSMSLEMQSFFGTTGTCQNTMFTCGIQRQWKWKKNSDHYCLPGTL